MAAVISGGRRLLIVLLLCVAFNQCWRYLCCLSRATVGVDRICSFWGSAGLLEKESWIKWYLLQRPGYQTTNKSYFSAADEVCLANRRWNVLFVIDTSKWCNYSLSNVVTEYGSHSLYLTYYWLLDSAFPRMPRHPMSAVSQFVKECFLKETSSLCWRLSIEIFQLVMC